MEDLELSKTTNCIKEMGFRDVIIETDSCSVVSLVNYPTENWSHMGMLVVDAQSVIERGWNRACDC